jgi:hypothetical protein
LPDVLLSIRAEDDLRRLEKLERERVRRALASLAVGAPNLDIRPLVGHEPWRRLRVGNRRVIFRRTVQGGGVEGPIRVARIVNRRDLEAVARGLAVV